MVLPSQGTGDDALTPFVIVLDRINGAGLNGVPPEAEIVEACGARGVLVFSGDVEIGEPGITKPERGWSDLFGMDPNFTGAA